MKVNTQSPTATPSTEDEWIIHSINIHGVFFERWCQAQIGKTPPWSVKSTNYPVEFPPPDGPWRGKESTLDIRAEMEHSGDLLTLIIECKKNNPDFVKWVFFPKPSEHIYTIVSSQIENSLRPTEEAGWVSQSSLRNGPFASQRLADEARETRGDYRSYQKNDKTKTSNASITDAAYQVALATQAINHNETKFGSALGATSTPPAMPWKRQLFLPVIVTTARLFTCTFEADNIHPATGEIPYASTTLEEQPFLFYEYPLPRHLQMSPSDLAQTLKAGSIEWFTHMHIAVVYSGKLTDFLNSFAKLWSDISGDTKGDSNGVKPESTS